MRMRTNLLSKAVKNSSTNSKEISKRLKKIEEERNKIGGKF